MVQWRPFLMISWGILLGLFLWTVLPVLSPLVLFLVLAYMLWPLFGTDTYKRLMLPLGALTFLWLLHVAGSVLAPFVLAFVLAYVADPLVDWWSGRGIGRTWGALGVLLLALIAGRPRRGPDRAPGRRARRAVPDRSSAHHGGAPGLVQRAGHGAGELPASAHPGYPLRAGARRREPGRGTVPAGRAASASIRPGKRRWASAAASRPVSRSSDTSS